MKINQKLLPVKAHWFFFMAISGPILPFYIVYGKQLGISEVVMGSITAVLPLLFFVSKPLFGFIADYYHQHRKLIFMSLICSMGMLYVLLYFIPPSSYYRNEIISFSLGDNCEGVNICTKEDVDDYKPCVSDNIRKATCNISCPQKLYTLPSLLKKNESKVISWICMEEATANITEICDLSDIEACKMTCFTSEDQECIYTTFTFYAFTILMCSGMIAYNVANSVSDAICFDVLGSGNEKNYGKERVWGSIGFGIAALLGGLSMDLWSGGSEVKDYTPAFIMVVVFTVFDIICCSKLKLPKMRQSENILKDMGKVLKHKHILIFLTFATFAGIFDSFIIYFMFWFLEDLAMSTHSMSNIKFLEGLTVAAETLGGELIFFPLAGKIIEKIGFGHSFTLCFFNYALRLGLISLLPSPWWIILVEFFMQGPTYALCYTTIVAYASAVSPPGTSATMQGLVAGMDDGFGYAIGSFIGGFLYSAVGGRLAFQIFCGAAFICSGSHFLLYKFVLSKSTEVSIGTNKANNAIQYKTAEEALQVTDMHDRS